MVCFYYPQTTRTVIIKTIVHSYWNRRYTFFIFSAELEETIIARDSVIGELRDNVSQSASHVKNLQENLMSATESIKSTDGDQSEVRMLC